MRVLIRVGVCLLLVLAGSAAAEMGPDGAHALAAQLRVWLSFILGPDAPELPVRAEVEGDHYRVVVPLLGMRTQGVEPAVTAATRQLPDGRWAIDDVRFPDKFAFTTRPMPPGTGPGTRTVVIGDQHARATIDPALHLPSSFDLDEAGIIITTSGSHQTQEQRIDRYTATGTVTPRDGGLVDVSTSTHVDGWRSGAMAPNGLAAGSGLRSAEATARIDGLAPSQVGPAVAALVSLGLALPAPRTRNETGSGVGLPELTPAGLAALHRLVAVLPGIATALRIDETLEGVQFEVAGIGGAAIDRVRLGFGGEAPAGLLRAWFDLALDGLSIRGLPAEQAALVPRMVSFRPSLSGVPVKALNRLLAILTEPDRSASTRLDPEIAALFAEGSLTLGIEALAVAIGPAEFTGAGSLLLLSPTEREGQARITATGFDALVDQGRTNPRLAAALPLLILARGLAKPDGDRLVWTIATDRSGRTTVNGVRFPGRPGGSGQGGNQP